MDKEIPMEIATMGVSPKYEWGDIPMDIANKIREHIEYADYEAFSEVCSSWRLATKEFPCQYINRKGTILPWLMLADKDDSSYRRYYSLTKRKFLKIYNPSCLSPPQCRRYFSSRGWLISVSRNMSKSNSVDTYFNITIFNPFSNNNVIIEAPLFHTDSFEAREWEDHRLVCFFGKFSISTSANAKDIDDFVVAMTFSCHRKVTYWRLRYDNTWIVPDHRGLLEDLYFFRGELYATEYDGLTCNIIAFGDFKDLKNRPQPRIVTHLGDLRNLYQLPADMEDEESNYYLVESKHDQSHTSSLFVIHRYIVIESYEENKTKTGSFNVVKLNVDNGNFEHVKSLGNQAIFVGFNSTFSVNVDDDSGCKADCIYYTDDYWRGYVAVKEGGGSDMGIYSLQEGNTLPFYQGLSQFSVINPPLWIEFSSAAWCFF